MEMPFGLYPQFYVKRKAQLFPLIEKYTGEKIASGTPHGKVIPIYYRLLKTDEAFKAEVDALISAQSSKLATAKQKVALAKAAKENPNKSLESNLHNNAGYQNAGGFFGTLVDTIGGVVGSVKEQQAAKAESDATFMEIVLNEQKTNDTTTLLIVTGVTLAFVGLGVFLVLKLRKK